MYLFKQRSFKLLPLPYILASKCLFKTLHTEMRHKLSVKFSRGKLGAGGVSDSLGCEVGPGDGIGGGKGIGGGDLWERMACAGWGLE